MEVELSLLEKGNVTQICHTLCCFYYVKIQHIVDLTVIITSHPPSIRTYEIMIIVKLV